MADIGNVLLGGLGIPGVGTGGVPGIGNPLMDLLGKLGMTPENVANNFPLLQLAKGNIGGAATGGLLPPGILK